jgi:hypothetical protein
LPHWPFFGTMLFSCNEEKFPESEIRRIDSSILQSTGGSVLLHEGILEFTTVGAFNEFCEKLKSDNGFKENMEQKYGDVLLIGDVRKGKVSDRQRQIIENIPTAYVYLLNKDAAYIINGQYVRFGKKEQFFVDKSKKDQIDWANEDTINRNEVRTYKYGRSSNILLESFSNARLDFNADAYAVGGDQAQFWQFTPVAGWRKWVDEIDARIAAIVFVPGQLDPQNYYPQITMEVKYKAKLEWKGSGSWQPASNYRVITPNFSYTLKFGVDPATAVTVAARTVGPNCCNGQPPVGPIYGRTDWEYSMANYTYVDRFNQQGSSKWYLTGLGTVKHYIDGDDQVNVWDRPISW